MSHGNTYQRLEVLSGLRDASTLTPTHGAICQLLDYIIEQGGFVTEAEVAEMIDEAIGTVLDTDFPQA